MGKFRNFHGTTKKGYRYTGFSVRGRKRSTTKTVFGGGKLRSIKTTKRYR